MGARILLAVLWLLHWLPLGALAVLGNLFGRLGYRVVRSRRKVALRIYSTPGNIPRCRHAMEAIKKAFRWDEERFGREYDLDAFMIFCGLRSRTSTQDH